MVRIRAMEIFTSAVCNLDCRYCYIPKSKTMRKIHKELLANLKTVDFSDISSITRNIEYLGLWGAEPTASLHNISVRIEKLKRFFPNIKQISFSTNGMNIEPIKEIIDECNKHKINLDIQFSFDGPEYINAMNRMPNILSNVLYNIREIIKWLNKKDLGIDVILRGKATLTIENVRYLLTNNLVEDYVEFFSELSNELEKLISNHRVRLLSPLTFNTEVPGSYSSEDGKYFAKFLQEIHKLGFDSAYTSRLMRIISLRNSLPSKPEMFTCSGGDSNIGYDFRRFHICHRTFMLDNDEYLQDIIKNKPDNWDVQNLKRGTADQTKKYYIVEMERLPKFIYLLRAYHDFWRLRITNTIIEIKELAASGQIASYYKTNDEMAYLLALFLNVANACPVENVLVTGSLFVMPPSVIRLWGNGAFYELLKHTIRR